MQTILDILKRAGPFLSPKEEVMFQFTFRLKIAERVKARCDRHPRYNPQRDGRGGIKGGCSTCFTLLDLHQARLTLETAHRDFIRKATPWTQVRLKRAKPPSFDQEQPEQR